MNNPFTPMFGVLPNNFIGREQIINDYVHATDNLNSPYRNMLITGIRGSGKTTLLNDVYKKMEKDPKKLVMKFTSTDDLLVEIINESARKTKGLFKRTFEQVTGLIVAVMGASFSFNREKSSLSFRHVFEDVLKEVNASGRTVVILIDEIQNVTEDLKKFCVAYQHFLQDDIKITLVMTGLNQAISDVLNDKVLTFLRRAKRVVLPNIDLALVKESYTLIFDQYEYGYDKEAIEYITNVSEGYAYFYQLIGYNLYESNLHISLDVAKQIVEESKIDLYQNVNELLWAELSDKDKEYLIAMCEDEGESKTSDITNRMGQNRTYVTNYRKRLIDKGAIYQTTRGNVKFTLLFMKEFILENI